MGVPQHARTLRAAGGAEDEGRAIRVVPRSDVLKYRDRAWRARDVEAVVLGPEEELRYVPGPEDVEPVAVAPPAEDLHAAQDGRFLMPRSVEDKVVIWEVHERHTFDARVPRE